MDLLYPDLIYEITKKLKNKDLYHFLTCNRFLYQFIGLYYERTILNYSNPFLRKELVVNLSIGCSYIYENNLNFFEKLVYFFKKYYRYWKKKSYLNTYRYSILVKHVDIKISEFRNLNKLIFDDFFNQELVFDFPSQLKHIVFGKRFNQKIDELPDSIEKIEFDHRSLFNQKISKYPSHLKEIILSRMFNQPLENLPDSLEIINMKHCDYFFQNIDALPKNIKILILRGNINVECEIGKNVMIYKYMYSQIQFKDENVNVKTWCYSDPF
jgi:hypothetical protein